MSTTPPLAPLYPTNPIDWLRVLVWLCLTPAYFARTHITNASALRATSIWLVNVLAWLPLALPLLAATLGTLPYDHPRRLPILLGLVMAGVLLTRWLDQLGSRQPAPYIPIVLMAGVIASMNGTTLTGTEGGLAVVLAAACACLLANQVEAGGGVVVSLISAMTQGVILIGGEGAASAGGVAAFTAFWVTVIVNHRFPAHQYGAVMFVLVGTIVAGLVDGWQAALAFGVVALVALGALKTLPNRLSTGILMGRGSLVGVGIFVGLCLAHGVLLAWCF